VAQLRVDNARHQARHDRKPRKGKTEQHAEASAE
jgi:hypothetical protein